MTKLKKYLKEIIVFIVVLFIAMNLLSYYRSMDLNKNRLDITSFKLLNGKEYSISKDKPILIYFWATWCPICKFQSPNIQKLSKDYEVITIAVQSGGKKQIQNYLDKNNFSFKVVDDTDGFYAKRFNIKVFPTTIIYDKDKEQKFSDVGYTSFWSIYLKLLISN